MKKPNLVAAKDILKKISESAENEMLLIGGLAVNQYHLTRDSQDIDLICGHDESLRLIDKVFPTSLWERKEVNSDSLRPLWEITHKTDNAMPVVKFGPKIIERGSYAYIDEKKLWKNAQKFKFSNNEVLDNIYVPCIEMICYTKMVSALGRSDEKADKIKKDIDDVINLTNQAKFGLGEFILMFSDEFKQRIKEDFATRLKIANALFKDSYIYQYVDTFKCIVDLDDNKKPKHFAEDNNSPRKLNPTGVVAFDVDGVLIKGIRHSWTLLWNLINKSTEDQYTRKDRFQTNKITYLEWVKQDLKDLKDAKFNVEDLREFIKGKCGLVKNLRSEINRLRENGYITAIISGGVDTILFELLPDAHDLFDEIFINKFTYDKNGFIENISATEYDWSDDKRGVVGKNRGLERVCEKYGVPLSKSVFVGDDRNDLKAMKIAGRSIFFCSEGQRNFQRDRNYPTNVVNIYDKDLKFVVDVILGKNELSREL
ncbi:MAG: HAD-IB family phosphatase [Firmicutes bacterium]|nr:HAD-IB family phosphatase [Bacillota bacterium]